MLKRYSYDTFEDLMEKVDELMLIDGRKKVEFEAEFLEGDYKGKVKLSDYVHDKGKRCLCLVFPNVNDDGNNGEFYFSRKETLEMKADGIRKHVEKYFSSIIKPTKEETAIIVETVREAFNLAKEYVMDNKDGIVFSEYRDFFVINSNLKTVMVNFTYSCYNDKQDFFDKDTFLNMSYEDFTKSMNRGKVFGFPCF